MYGSQTPIDIHCSKLVDWLVQHRHCRKDWGENLASIRRKIRSALKDMPENEEIKQLLIGSKLDYFKSRRIVEILKTTEASSKNIFGFYSSQRMKDWQDIVTAYQRDYVYLAEIATDLIRETNYEVPGIKKVINRLNREKDDADKERSNLQRRAQQFNSEYQKLAQTYGIKGNNVGQELEEQFKGLVKVMDQIVVLSKDLNTATNHYRDFANSTSKCDVEKIIPVLHYVIEKSNTTVYQYKNGEAPDRVEVVEKSISSGNSNSSEIELVDDEIDFGDDPPSSDSSSGFVHVNKAEESPIEMEESTTLTVVDSQNLSCDTNDKVARGEDAKLVLESRKTRNQFLNNLHELEAFYIELHSQLSSSESGSSGIDTSESFKTRRFDVGEINDILVKIRAIIALMNQEKNKLLFQMNDSPCFLENIKDKFATKLRQQSDCNVKANIISDHIKELEAQIRETEIHLKKCTAAVKALQNQVETNLSELYKGRTINIMGCLN